MNKESNISRRTFLKNGTIATVAGTLLASETLPDQSTATFYKKGSQGEKLIGCYSNYKEIVENPKYIDALQEKFGVNVLLAGSYVNIPDWLRAMNPLVGTERVMYIGFTDDDSDLIKAIEETHRRGMQFWLYFSGHHNSPKDREPMSETFEGVKYSDLPRIKYSPSSCVEFTTCFSKPNVMAYEKQLFGYSSKHYGVDNMYVSHTRYATPSFWTNIFGCACSDCQKAAYRMGYDFEKMRKSMQNLRSKLENLDKNTLELVAKNRLIFTDFLTMLGEDNGVLDWLYFRAKVVGNALKNIHDSVHTSTNHRCGFVTDTHNITMSLLVGHNYEDLIGGATDGLHPLSWCAIQHIAVIAAWANQLCEWVPGLEEKTSLKIVTALFGWDEIGLPDKKIADLRIGRTQVENTKMGNREPDGPFYSYFNPDLTVKLMVHEWTRMAAINRGRIPTHPVIKGHEWPEKVCRELMDRADDIGLTGYIFQRTDQLIDRDKL